MMSRTVRYFKLIYIVAGILMSNADICETVDQIQIAPRMEVKDILGVQRYRSRARLTESSNNNSNSNNSNNNNKNNNSNNNNNNSSSNSSRSSSSSSSNYNNTKSNGISIANSLALGLRITDVGNLSRNWLQKFDIFGISRIKQRLSPILRTFTIWTIPNYLIDRSTNYISSRFIISSDCDMIYHK